MLISQRAKQIRPFHVMDILAQAKQLEAQGKDIIHLEVGEPDFITPQPIIDAGISALKAGKTHYTAALGLPALREALAQWYQDYYQVNIPASRIIVTPGASGALLLLIGALLEKDKNILLTDPGYPCNRHFARFVEAKTKNVPVGPDTSYQLTAEHIQQYWDEQTSLALVASPSNPTGSMLSADELKALSIAIHAKDGYLAVDEIYHGLTYDGLKAQTVLAIDDNAFVLNSFSKFFGMTGWRLGWLVVPEEYVAVMDRLAQNLFLAAPTMSQYAALAAFKPETQTILETRRQQFEQRRNCLLSALGEIGISVNYQPQGAFYIYADCSHLLTEQQPDSMSLAAYWLKKAGVATTPGNDFGDYMANKYIRFAYTCEQSRLLEAIERLSTLRV